MSTDAAPSSRHWAWAELALCLILAAGAAAWINLHAGYLGWSWDAINHHIYLGYLAETSRWHLDVAPASTQTYQHPYLYWPVYRISLLSGNGALIGSAWSAFQALCALPPVWWISRQLLPDSGPGHAQRIQGLLWRVSACAFAGCSAVVLTVLETTGNDLLAAVPLLWALALSIRSRDSLGNAGLAAALWGVSTALKLSNGLFLPLLLALWWVPGRPHWSLKRAAALGGAAAAGFGVVYAPWGWQLWQLTGNPFYPMLGQLFGSR